MNSRLLVTLRTKTNIKGPGRKFNLGKNFSFEIIQNGFGRFTTPETFNVN